MINSTYLKNSNLFEMSKLTREYLDTLSKEDKEKEVVQEYIKCKLDPKYCIETYFTVDAGGTRKPFILYPHQIDALYAYETYTNNISMKTRQMGFTSFTSAYLAYKMITENSYKVLVISKTMTDAKDFLKTIKDILVECNKEFPWLFTGFKEGYNNKESFTLKNESFVKAQSTSDDAGRGVPGLKCLVVDEVAFVDRRSPDKMEEIWAAAGPALTTVRGKAIMISTPRGTSGWYYNTYTNAKKMGFHVIDAHWIKHPMFSMGAYRWIPDEKSIEGGSLKFYNDFWPEQIFDKEQGIFITLDKEKYTFIKDGKLRSPWYDFESARLGPNKTKCELDCSFMGTGGEVLESELLAEYQNEINTGKYKDFATPLAHVNGIYRDYKEYIKPQVGHRYVLSGDVATGDGSDYSGFTVIDIDTLEICATFKAQLIPDLYGKLINIIGRKYNNAVAVVENAGGGGTTLQTLKELSYPNIYYSILKKNDPSSGLKKKKIGLWPSEEVRWQGGDRLEQLLRYKSIMLNCQDILNELYTWIWDKDGKRRHAPGKNDDLLMGLQHGVWYIYYVIKRSDRNRTNFNKIFELQRNGETVKVDSINQFTGLGTIGKTRSRNRYMPANSERVNTLNIEKESGMNLKRRMFI